MHGLQLGSCYPVLLAILRYVTIALSLFLMVIKEISDMG